MTEQAPVATYYRLTRPRLASLVAGPWAPLSTVITGHELTAVQTLNHRLRQLSQQQPERPMNDRDSIAAADDLIMPLLTASLHWDLEPEAWQDAIRLLQPAAPYADGLTQDLWSAYQATQDDERKTDLLSLLIKRPKLLHPREDDEHHPEVSAFRAHVPELLAGEHDAQRQLAFQFLVDLPLGKDNYHLILAGLPHAHQAMDRHTRAHYLMHIGRLHRLWPDTLDELENQARRQRSVVPKDPMLPDFNPPGYLVELIRLHQGYVPDRARPDWDWMLERMDEGSHNLAGLIPEAYVYTPGNPRKKQDLFKRVLTRTGLNGKPGLDLPMSSTADVMTSLAAQGHLPAWACRCVMHELQHMSLSAGPVNQHLSWLRLGAITGLRDALWAVFERPGLVKKANPLLLREVMERAWEGEAGLVRALRERQAQPIHPQSLVAHADFVRAQPIWCDRTGLSIPRPEEETSTQGGLQND